MQALAAGAVFPVGCSHRGFIRERRVQAHWHDCPGGDLGLRFLRHCISPVRSWHWRKARCSARRLRCCCSVRCSRAALWCSTWPRWARIRRTGRRPRHYGETEPRYRRLMRHITAVWAGAFLVRRQPAPVADSVDADRAVPAGQRGDVVGLRRPDAGVELASRQPADGTDRRLRRSDYSRLIVPASGPFWPWTTPMRTVWPS